MKAKEKTACEGRTSTLADPRNPRYEPPPGAGTVDVRRLLHWALGHQRAHLQAKAKGKISEEFWIKAGGLDSTRLCAINGEAGGPIDCSPAWLRGLAGGGVDEDAARVHDQVLVCVRDFRVYRLVVEHAFDDSAPDWYPGARCGLEPHRDALGRPLWETQHEQEWRGVWRGFVRVKRGNRLDWVEQEVVGAPPLAEGWKFLHSVRGDAVEHRYTPLYRPDDPEVVVDARRCYASWWQALDAVARALNVDAGRATGLSRWSRVTNGAPARPWSAADDARLGAMAATLRFAHLEALQQGWADPRVGRMTSGAPYRLT